MSWASRIWDVNTRAWAGLRNFFVCLFGPSLQWCGCAETLFVLCVFFVSPLTQQWPGMMAWFGCLFICLVVDVCNRLSGTAPTPAHRNLRSVPVEAHGGAGVAPPTSPLDRRVPVTSWDDGAWRVRVEGPAARTTPHMVRGERDTQRWKSSRRNPLLLASPPPLPPPLPPPRPRMVAPPLPAPCADDQVTTCVWPLARHRPCHTRHTLQAL